MSRDSRPLAVRNNNPLNIRFNPANDWVGQTGEQGGFVEFQSPEYGFRAAYKLLTNYRVRYGLNTISDIIRRWAPEHENPTSDYVQFVAAQTGLSANEQIGEERLVDVMNAMATFETGHGYWLPEQGEQGALLA